MIQKHFNYTGSTVAQFMLYDFENQLKNFVKVFPKDYKKVLQQKKRICSSEQMILFNVYCVTHLYVQNFYKQAAVSSDEQ